MFERTTPLLTALLTGLLAIAFVTATGCSTDRSEQKGGVITGAKPAKGKQPVEGALEGVEIAGYCPVAYVDANKPVKGVPEYPVQQNGVTYWFVDEGAQTAFVTNPNKYQVGYRGWCATALAAGEQVTSDPEVFRLHEGKIYLFANEKAAKAFDADPAGTVEKADKVWADLK